MFSSCYGSSSRCLARPRPTQSFCMSHLARFSPMQLLPLPRVFFTFSSTYLCCSFCFARACELHALRSSSPLCVSVQASTFCSFHVNFCMQLLLCSSCFLFSHALHVNFCSFFLFAVAFVLVYVAVSAPAYPTFQLAALEPESSSSIFGVHVYVFSLLLLRGTHIAPAFSRCCHVEKSNLQLRLQLNSFVNLLQLPYSHILHFLLEFASSFCCCFFSMFEPTS